MTVFDRIEAFICKHPLALLIAIVLIGGLLGMLDEESVLRQKAYLNDLAQQHNDTPSVDQQLTYLCSQPWPDVEGSVAARARVCPKE